MEKKGRKREDGRQGGRRELGKWKGGGGRKEEGERGEGGEGYISDGGLRMSTFEQRIHPHTV